MYEAIDLRPKLTSTTGWLAIGSLLQVDFDYIYVSCIFFFPDRYMFLGFNLRESEGCRALSIFLRKKNERKIVFSSPVLYISHAPAH